MNGKHRVGTAPGTSNQQKQAQDKALADEMKALEKKLRKEGKIK